MLLSEEKGANRYDSQVQSPNNWDRMLRSGKMGGEVSTSSLWSVPESWLKVTESQGTRLF